VFTRLEMEKRIPREIYKNIVLAIDGKEQIKPEFADAIAVAMKEWAVSCGATHYTHWFQPLTGFSAEKHDSFIEWHTEGVIEKFDGKQLIQGEPDASSFPSGGLRSTFEARGYTGWDPTSPAFVWDSGEGITLFIPSVFVSWTGDVLDCKLPLLRSDERINESVLRLLQLTGTPASRIYSNLGIEQEYFVVDRGLRDIRPDLLLAGRTVYGAPSAKGQELQDHYFGAVKDRVMAYMCEFEEDAIRLGIPVKTRHNEVAPAQYEVAPIFEKASVAADHNLLLMELMRKVAVKHNLVCLLHEKPFQGVNGSGKHNNWSLVTETGINLLEPTDRPGSSIQFLILMTAIIDAVHRHSALLRAAVGSAGNDHRLGGHEAPPAIISIYLGDELESVLHNIEKTGTHAKESAESKHNLGLLTLPELTKHTTDRNRTSPLAFTGNKFEFRAVGSSANSAWPMTVLNAIAAESLNEMLDTIEANLKGRNTKQALADAAVPVIRKFLKRSKAVRFSGDNYTKEWEKIAAKRHLPNIKCSADAFQVLKEKTTVKAFQGILTKQELQSRYEVMGELYAYTILIESNLMVEIFRTQIYPAALKMQKKMAKTLKVTKEAIGKGCPTQKKKLIEFIEAVRQASEAVDRLEQLRDQAAKYEGTAMVKAFAGKVVPQMKKTRLFVDALEKQVDDSLWPLPKYRELLFLI